jgi:homoserine dehydrogenase
MPPLGRPADELAPLITTATGAADQASFFIGAQLADKPGVFAALTEELAEAGVSIDKLIQESAGDSGAAPVAIMTHPCPRASVEQALAKVAQLKITTDEPRLLRIETRA